MPGGWGKEIDWLLTGGDKGGRIVEQEKCWVKKYMTMQKVGGKAEEIVRKKHDMVS